MPIDVFGNSSNNSESKIDTSPFVQEAYLTTIFNENNIEEDIDMKNQYRVQNIPDPISIREPASKDYVDNNLNDSIII